MGNRSISQMAAMAIAAVLSSCTPPSRLMNFPFDASGRSLNSPAAEMQPEIAGNYIVFTSDRNSRQDIYLYDLAARTSIELPGLNALDFVVSDADISADGRYIVLAGSRLGRSDIYLYDRTTRQLRKLTSNLRSQVRNPSISADGKTIAFETSENGQWDIYIYDRTGKAIDVPMMPR